MGLKSMLKEPPFTAELPLSRPEDAARIAELTEQIKALTSTICDKDATIQKMDSLLSKQQDHIDFLTERDSSVLAMEQKNEKLIEDNRAAQAALDRKTQDIKALEERDEYLRRSIREAEERKRKADQEAWEHEKAKRDAQEAARRAQTRYKTASIAVGVIAVVQAILLSWGRGSAWSEIGQWWVLRWHNIISAGRGIGVAFMWTATTMGSWGVPGAWRYVVAGAVAAGLGVGLFFLVRAGVAALSTVLRRIRKQYRDGVWKASMTAATALSLFFICLWAYTPLQAVWPFNIFSLWLLLALIGAAAWNFKEIKGAFV